VCPSVTLYVLGVCEPDLIVCPVVVSISDCMVKPLTGWLLVSTVEMLSDAVGPGEEVEVELDVLVVVVDVDLEVDVEVGACGSIVASVATVCEKSDDRVEYLFAPLRLSMYMYPTRGAALLTKVLL